MPRPSELSQPPRVPLPPVSATASSATSPRAAAATAGLPTPHDTASRPQLPRALVRRLADPAVRAERGRLTEVVARLSEEEWRTWMAWARYWQGPVPSGKGGPRRNDLVQYLTVRGLLYADGALVQHRPAETLIEGLEYLLEEFEASGAGGLLIGIWMLSHSPWTPRRARPLPPEAQGPTWHDVPAPRLAAALQTVLRLKHERILAAVLKTWPAEVLGLTDAVVWRLAARRANGTSDTWAETEEDLAAAPRRASSAPVIALLAELGLSDAPAALAARQDWPLDVQRWLIDAGGSGLLSKVGQGHAVPAEDLCRLLQHAPQTSSTWAEVRRLAIAADGQTDPGVARLAAQVVSEGIERLSAFPASWGPDDTTTREIEVWQTEHVGPWLDTPAFVSALSRGAVRQLLLSSSNAALRQRLIGALGQLTEEQGAAGVRSLSEGPSDQSPSDQSPSDQSPSDQSPLPDEARPKRASPARRP